MGSSPRTQGFWEPLFKYLNLNSSHRVGNQTEDGSTSGIYTGFSGWQLNIFALFN